MSQVSPFVVGLLLAFVTALVLMGNELLPSATLIATCVMTGVVVLAAIAYKVCARRAAR